MDNSYSQGRYQAQSKDRSPFDRRKEAGDSSFTQKQDSKLVEQRVPRTYNEEDEYNRRREEEIRKKISMNDS